jgi:hypothetical protein
MLKSDAKNRKAPDQFGEWQYEEMPDNKSKKRGRPPGGRRIHSSPVNRDQAASSSQSTQDTLSHQACSSSQSTKDELPDNRSKKKEDVLLVVKTR